MCAAHPGDGWMEKERMKEGLKTDVTQLPIPYGPATKVVVSLSTGKILVI